MCKMAPLGLCLHCVSQQRASTSVYYCSAHVLMLAFCQFSECRPTSFRMNYSSVCGTSFLLSAVKENCWEEAIFWLRHPPPPNTLELLHPPSTLCRMPARERCSPNHVDMTEIAQVTTTELRRVGQRLHFPSGVLPSSMCSLRISSYRR